MAWTFNSIRIFLQTRDESTSQVIARLQPVTGKTIKQFFGYESPIIKLTAYVVGDTDKDALKSYVTTNSSYALYQDTTLVGNYFVHSVSFSQVRSIGQTLRQDLACESPVYMMELEVYPDDE